MQPRFRRATLHYEGLTLHTASSGPVPGLDALYLELVSGGDVQARGEVRLNCTYLNGYAAGDLMRAAEDLAGALNWDRPAPDLRKAVAESGAPAPVRALLDVTLWDLEARRAGQPLAWHIAGRKTPLHRPTNQTLFLSTEAAFDAQAAAYVARGFRDLKVRVGKDFEADLDRLTRLRDRFGDSLTLSIDANCSWTPEQAQSCLARLAPLHLKYVEQPIAPGDWEALADLAAIAPMPIMLDESMSSPGDVDQIIAHADRAEGRLWAHLKLIKTGGITPALDALCRFDAAGIPYMIGQMNEGGLATAAAAHLALAFTPVSAELYGADGLIDDPAGGLSYRDGEIALPEAPGLGLTFYAQHAPLLQGDFT